MLEKVRRLYREKWLQASRPATADASPYSNDSKANSKNTKGILFVRGWPA